jgi:hypothetical protein
MEAGVCRVRGRSNEAFSGRASQPLEERCCPATWRLAKKERIFPNMADARLLHLVALEPFGV